MQTVCELNQCAGCMACVDVCPQHAITVQDDLVHYNAQIDMEKCIQCGLCHKVCQANTPVVKRTPKTWRQGWVKNESDRAKSASGGFASAIARSFVQEGGVVCACVFEEGTFRFRSFENADAIEQMAGSKYVKSNPEGIYKEIKKLLTDGRRVLFIGLPCQVASLFHVIRGALQKNLYTIDLICHGSPSPKLLEAFLAQYGYRLRDMKNIRFRQKDHFQVSGTSQELDAYRPIGSRGVLDPYMIGFLDCLFYTENCYECRYASTDRVSDLTLGDSWGSTLPESERKRGISLALCQTEKGQELLDLAPLHLEEVDIPAAIANNHQLREPSKAPEKRAAFFAGLKNGTPFNRLIWKCNPVKCLKQEIKKVLMRLRLWK